MRSYENSGYNPYNDNDRSQTKGSARNYYSDEFDITGRDRGAYGSNRGGEFGSGRDSYATSGYGGTSTYGHNAGSGVYGSSGNPYDNDRYSSNYGSSNYGSSGNRYSSDRNRHDDDSWWDNTKDKVSNAWDRATGDDDNDRNYRNRNYGTYDSGSSYTGRYGSDSSYGSGSSRNYGSGNYGSSYGSGSTGYGASYGTGYTTSNYGTPYRSSSDRDSYSSDYDRNRHSHDRHSDHDRGFFDKAGDEVKSWFGDDDAERRRRQDEMRDRRHDRDYDSDSNRYGSSTGNTYSGPPYSYGSSSRRDYEW